MASIKFDNCLILRTNFATSKSGNPYCVLQFLDNDSLMVFDVMQFGDSASVAAGLAVGSLVGLGFNLSPRRDGGVSLQLVDVYR